MLVSSDDCEIKIVRNTFGAELSAFRRDLKQKRRASVTKGKDKLN
jgi:hypothetical protein